MSSFAAGRFGPGYHGRRMRPEDLVTVRFSRVGRRGVKATEVYAFLAQVREELAARDELESSLRLAAVAAEGENERIKQALQEWQARTARTPPTQEVPDVPQAGGPE